MRLIYKKGDIFEKLVEGIIYVQSCNGQNIWGAGISLKFRKNFPDAYQIYQKKKNRVGDGYIVNHGKYLIGCLITSEFYGKLKDPPKKILVQTYTALQNMFQTISEKEITIYSPKINSGYFATPWDATEKVIIRACENIDKKIGWVVWEF